MALDCACKRGVTCSRGVNDDGDDDDDDGER